MTVEKFVEFWTNKYCDFDKTYGPQCKDLFSQYNIDVVGNPNYVGGDAWKLWDNAPDSYYEKVLNTPTSVPLNGDVIIWDKAFGGYGHVAIFLDGDVNKMRVFGQNYPNVTKLDANNKVIANGSPCQIVTMPYTKVKGYLRPKNLHIPAPEPVVTPPPPPPPTVDPKDAVIADLTHNLDIANQTIAELKAKITSLEGTPPTEVIKEVPVEKIVIQDKPQTFNESLKIVVETIKSWFNKRS